MYWGRKIVVNMVVNTSTGVKRLTVDSDSLDIDFDCTKTDKPENNEGSVTLWNLNQNTRTILESMKSGTITILAGYTQSVGISVVYVGDITTMESERKAGDRATTFTLATGSNARREGEISRSWKGITTVDVVVRGILEGSGLTLSPNSVLPTKQWSRGLALSGNRISMLQQVLQGTGATFTIDDNVLKVVSNGSQMGGSIVHLSPDSGLLELPTRSIKIRKASSAGETATKRVQAGESDCGDTSTDDSGTTIKSLLNPLIVPHGKVSIQSKSINGIFKVRSVTHSGSTTGTDFTSEIELVDNV